MQRYSTVVGGDPRELVLLRGRGCAYRLCAFCDYHEDASTDEAANLRLNAKTLAQVRGTTGVLEAINSGSFNELDESTIQLLLDTCVKQGIHTLIVECHWLYRRHIPAFRQRCIDLGITPKLKIGVETFDADFRENVMHKGIRETDPTKIAEGFEQANFLVGLHGQTVEGMINDAETGLQLFERICLNTMTPCHAPLGPDPEVVRAFIEQVAPRYANNPRVDMLFTNTDFGVGTPNEEE